MDVTITILGRSFVDEPFTELGSEIVQLPNGTEVIHTPVIPSAAAGKELRIRLWATNSFTFKTGQFIDPATRPGPSPRFDGNGVQVGTDPAPAPVLSDPFPVWGGKVTPGAPFNPRFGSVLIRDLGAPA